MRAFISVALFALAASAAAPLLTGCTQDENSSNAERDTHMGVTRMAPLPPPLPEVVAAVAPAPAAAPSGSASAPASASASAPAPAKAAAPPKKH